MRFRNKKNNWHEFFVDHIFSFGQVGQIPYTSSFVFRRDGTIRFGQGNSANERYWELTDYNLEIKNENFETTTVFQISEDSKDTFKGVFIPDPNIKHQLSVVSEFEAVLDVIDNQNDRISTAVIQQQNAIQDQVRMSTTSHKHKLIRVAFILNAIETVNAAIPLMRALLNDARFEIRVVPLNRIFRGAEQPGSRELLVAELEKHGIATVTVSADPSDVIGRLRDWRPDFLFRQSEWDQDFPEEFSARNLFWTKIIHTSYVVTENFVFNPNSELPFFMLDYYEKIWRYFVAEPLTEHDMSLLSKTFISAEVFSPVGSIKAIEISNTEAHWPVKTNKKKVIWMPHHSIGDEWFAFGTFDKIYTIMLNWAEMHPDISVVFNPHPSLSAVITQGTGDISQDEYHDFMQSWEALPNTEVLVQTNSYPAVAAADVVLSDGISILYEAQILRKNIVFIENPNHVLFTDYGEKLARGFHREENIEQALLLTEQLLDTKNNDLLDFQIENTAAWLKNDKPEQAIIEEMVEEIDSIKIGK